MADPYIQTLRLIIAWMLCLEIASQSATDQTTTCRILKEKLLLEEGFHNSEKDKFLGDGNERLTVLISWRPNFDLTSIMRAQDGWTSAMFTSSGLVDHDTSNKVYGRVFYKDSSYVYCPAWNTSHKVSDRLERSFYERLLLSSSRSLKLVVVADNPGPISKDAGDFLIQIASLMEEPVVINLVSDTKSLSLKEMRRLLAKCRECGIFDIVPWRWDPFRDIQRYVGMRTRIKNYSPAFLGKKKIEEIQIMFKLMFRKFDCLFFRFKDELLDAIRSFTATEDASLVDDLNSEVETITERFSTAATFLEMLNVALQSDIQLFVPYNDQTISSLYDFARYITFVEQTFQLESLFEPTAIRDAFADLKNQTNSLRTWKNYYFEIKESLFGEKHEQVHALLQTDDIDHFRQKICSELEFCWEKPYTETEARDIEEMKRLLEVQSSCSDGVLTITGITLSSKDIVNVTEMAYECSYHTIFTVAVLDISFGDEMNFTGKNFVVFAPTWKSFNNPQITLSGENSDALNDVQSEGDDEDPPGGNGGNFLGYVRNYEGDELTIASNGGNGSQGQSSTLEIWNSEMVSDRNGGCVVQDDVAKKVWFNYAATTGGFGGLRGEIKVVALSDDADVESKIIRTGDDGEHGPDGENSEAKIYCEDGTFATYKSDEIAVAEAERSDLPPSLSEDQAWKTYRSLYQKMMYRFNVKVQVEEMKGNQTEPLEKISPIVDEILNFVHNPPNPSCKAKSVLDSHVTSVNKYMGDVGVTNISNDDKIQLNYLYAVMAVRNARITPYRSSLIMNIEMYFDSILRHIQQLKEQENVWNIAYIQQDNYNRYVSMLDNLKSFGANILRPAINYVTRFLAKALTDDNSSAQHVEKSIQLLALAKKGLPCRFLGIDEWTNYGFPKRIVRSFSFSSPISLLQKYMSVRPKRSGHLTTKANSRGVISERYLEINAILAICQKYANDNLNVKMTALYKYIDVLKRLTDNEAVKTKCSDCKDVLDEVQDQIKAFYEDCYESSERLAFRRNPNFVINDTEYVEPFFACDPENYTENYLKLHQTVQEKLDNLREMLESEQSVGLKQFLAPKNRFLIFLEIILQAVDGRATQKHLLNNSGSFEYLDSPLYRFLREDETDLQFYSVLRSDATKTAQLLTSPNENPLNALYINLIRKAAYLHKLAGSAMYTQPPFEFFNDVASKLKTALNILIRTYRKLKYLQEDSDIAHFIENINLNRPSEASLTTKSARIQVKKLDRALRLEMAGLRYEQAKKAFQALVFPFAHEFENDSGLPRNVRDYERLMQELIQQKKEHAMARDQVHSIFDPDACNGTCDAFYTWTTNEIKSYGHDMDAALRGSPLHLLADIRKSSFRYDALKGKSFQIRLIPKMKPSDPRYATEILRINSHLQGCYADITHGGVSFSKYAKMTYVTSSQNITFVRTALSPGIVNVAHKKMSKIDFVLSPFAAWSFKLYDPKGVLRKIRHLVGGFELVGEGEYLKDSKDLHTERYYELEFDVFGKLPFYTTLH